MMNSEVSTSVVSYDQMESVCVLTEWFCDVDSPIPSWYHLRWGGVAFALLFSSLEFPIYF